MIPPIFTGIFHKFGELFARKDFLVLAGVYIKWYFLIMPIAIATVYQIYLALERKGIPQKFFAHVEVLLMDIERTSTTCAPLLVENMQRFLDCL